MRLSELLGADFPLSPEIDREVAGLALDSRRLRPGDAFVALPGCRGHGLAHVDAAVNAGAVAVLTEPGESLRASVPVIPVAGLRGRLGELADRLHGEPSRRLRVIGVTGTNGKTSVAGFISQALAADGPVGHLGTLGQGRWGQLEPTPNTTPDVLTVHRRLAEAVAAGARAAVMEVSSHALDQGRVDGVRFACAVFTNLTRDHLDYHGDMAAYAEAKAKLFHVHRPESAVINRDDPFGTRLAEAFSGPLWRYGLTASDVDLHAEGLVVRESGLAFTLVEGDDRAWLETNLLGRFQVANLLAAAGALSALGMPLAEIAERLSRVQAPVGRMEPFRAEGWPLVVVDYAHTPDALAAALASLRPHTAGRLWCVFGCGGERDEGKRPLMGAQAEAGADRVIVTDDNPRAEDPARIASQILAGMRRPGEVRVIHDRDEAIAQALRQAAPEDVVLVAGKGHETTQQVGDAVYPHDDRRVVAEMLGMTR